jgi:hypothetical protein
MALSFPVETKRKYFTVEEANRALPLVRAIVTDIVSQWKVVEGLDLRLKAVLKRDHKRLAGDPYSEELAQSQAELETEDAKLREYVEELERLGVELKSSAGLCDFYSLRDGREIYLCWQLGEPEIAHWHELNGGFDGRQPLLPAKAGSRSRS